MAKPLSSAIGIDLGQHSLKAVALQRKGANRFALTHYAIAELNGAESADDLAQAFRSILTKLGAKAKGVAVTISGGGSFVRIIEQPAMPPHLLRDALRLNGSTLLNQDCREMVIDCDVVPSSEPREGAEAQQTFSYVVGGVPRSYVNLMEEVSHKAKIPTTLLQLSPVSLFNAFEAAHPETFANQAFVLVDIGHTTTSIIIGARREMVLVRAMEFGGSPFLEQMIYNGAASAEELAQHLAEEEILTIENARLCLTELVRSISSSISFIEARRETSIPRVFVSGGMACSPAILRVLTEELQLPCDAWNPAETCDVSLSSASKATFPTQYPQLGAACGAAIELLQGRP